MHPCAARVQLRAIPLADVVCDIFADIGGILADDKTWRISSVPLPPHLVHLLLTHSGRWLAEWWRIRVEKSSLHLRPSVAILIRGGSHMGSLDCTSIGSIGA